MRGHLKTISTFFIAPLMVGLVVAGSALGGFGLEGYGPSQWCLAIPLALLGGLIIGALLNFAIFAPVYWFLGRLNSRKTKRDKAS
jgi:hypothetical protein